MLKVERTLLDGVFLVVPATYEDKRGNFYETYNEQEYYNAGLTARFVQDDVTKSVKGVLKGMHGDQGTYKLIQCVYGTVYVVILDCDEKSPTFGKWQSFVLTDDNKQQIYIPPMYGTGFFVMSDVAVFTYKQSSYYGQYKQFTYKWNDTRFGIKWPEGDKIISERDS